MHPGDYYAPIGRGKAVCYCRFIYGKKLGDESGISGLLMYLLLISKEMR